MHLVSRVVGQLREDLDAPARLPSLYEHGYANGRTKNPRNAAYPWRRKNSSSSSYGGAVSYLTGEGTLDTCIVIRSAYVEDGVAQVQAGAGVVFDSDPQAKQMKLAAKLKRSSLRFKQLILKTLQQIWTHQTEGVVIMADIVFIDNFDSFAWPCRPVSFIRSQRKDLP